jgi:hypothetical protein
MEQVVPRFSVIQSFFIVGVHVFGVMEVAGF